MSHLIRLARYTKINGDDATNTKETHNSGKSNWSAVCLDLETCVNYIEAESDGHLHLCYVKDPSAEISRCKILWDALLSKEISGMAKLRWLLGADIAQKYCRPLD